MNLKEAFRFQNKLGNLMDEAQMILKSDSNITEVKNTYLRKKVMAEVEDETIIVDAPTEYSDKITEVVKFLIYLMGEREKLYKAIHDAKNALPIDMDSEVSLNSKRQEIARVFKYMTGLRNSEITIPSGGTGYRFNQEGNQVTYRCDVKRVTTINYDRNAVRNLLSEMNRKMDTVSAEIDRCMVNSEVKYDVPFDVNDGFSEVFETFVSQGQE